MQLVAQSNSDEASSSAGAHVASRNLPGTVHPGSVVSTLLAGSVA